MEYIVLLGVAWLACVFLALHVAHEKGRTLTEGVVLSVVFGPFGVLILALLPTLRAVGAAPGAVPAPGASPTPAPSPNGSPRRNPPESEWQDLINWRGVETDDQELQAKKRAYAKYLAFFGPKPRDVSSSKTHVFYTCSCGQFSATPIALAGKVVACNGCQLHLVVPYADAGPETAV